MALQNLQEDIPPDENAPASRTHSNGGSKRREMAGVILVLLAIFLLASLVSHSPDDPSIHHYSLEGSRNWMGPVGANLAAVLFASMGYAAWLIPLLPLGIAVHLFGIAPSILAPPGPFAAGWAALALAGCIFLALLPVKVLSAPGGVIGLVLTRFLRQVIGAAGTLLIVFVLLLSSFLAATPFSLSDGINLLRRKGPKGASSGTSTPLPSSQGPPAPSEPRISEPKRPEPVGKPQREWKQKEIAFEVTPAAGTYRIPPLEFLEEPKQDEATIVDKKTYLANAHVLEQKLLDFGVAGKVVEICPGPVVTMYEFSPAPGVKITKVTSLADDLALALRSTSVRIVAPIPGKSVIGIELANPTRRIVSLKEILESETFEKHRGLLPLALGHDIVGVPVVTDLAKMPHLLIAGATGTGKSVGLNAMICSLLYRHTPERLRLLMIDPKRIELSLYDNIPHLIHPVVSEPKEATRALRWAVLEMERRYQILESAQARNLEGYNKSADSPLPYLVVIIDELADLMMVSSKEVEGAIARLAQMARAAGIHLLIATQRPSVDVLTGLIKANFPARISFKVSSKVDSRTILDVIGAERLLGMGDMLFLPPGSSSLQRIHGAYVSEREIVQIVSFLKAQGEPDYDPSVVEPISEEGDNEAGPGEEAVDEMYDEAVRIVKETGQASISMLQRRLRVGYNRSARMIEQMERDGIVTPTDSMGRRHVLDRLP
ncbi:MAG: DNA translocase FtsK [Deltaproteobacteria bacterium]